MIIDLALKKEKDATENIQDKPISKKIIISLVLILLIPDTFFCIMKVSLFNKYKTILEKVWKTVLQ